MNDKEKDVTVKEAFDCLKEEADEFGAASAKLTFNDAQWQYTLEVKRIKR